ncbi:MAG: hypothetical protein HY983_03635, partial [Candidatus Magasanikbacteria bacterium]|nr:hypothetical protein [Candidatus Magasanikbacteria bacterium]
NGKFGCDTDQTGASATVPDVVVSSTFGVNNVATVSSSLGWWMKGAAYASSTLTITATTTYFSDLIFNGTVLNRPLYGLIIAGGASGGDNGRGFWFATTTGGASGGQGQEPILAIMSTTTGALDYGRVGINTSTYWGGPIRDQLTVAGRIYSTWRKFGCDTPAVGLIGSNIVADNLYVGCPPFVLDMNGTASGAGVIGGATTTGAGGNLYPPFMRLTTAVTAVAAANDQAVLRTWNFIAAASSSMTMEAWVRVPYAPMSVGSVYFVGFSNLAVNTAYGSGPGAVYGFIATSSKNWRAFSSSTPNLSSLTDTGVATSSFTKLRIEVTPSSAVYLVNGKVVAQHTSNLSSATMAPMILTGATAAGGSSRSLDISLIRVWVDDPPGGVGAPDGSSSGATDSVDTAPVFSQDYNNQSSDGLWYPSNETPGSLPPGSLVALSDYSATNTIKVVSSTYAYQEAVIGVVTENPHTMLGEKTGDVPVAINGRVGVLVTNENGDIKAGDYLVAGSLPGHAMRATKAGMSIGQALTAFAGTGEGTVVMLVKPTYYSGSRLEGLFAGLDISSSSTSTLAQQLLSQFALNKAFFATSTSSDLVVDRIAAGMQLITPQITTEQVVVNSLKTTSSSLVIELFDNQELVITASSTNGLAITTSTVVRFDTKGNADFAGTLTVDTLKANHIEGLDVLSDRLTSLEGAFVSSTALTDLSFQNVSSSLAVLSTRLDQNDGLLQTLRQQLASTTSTASTTLTLESLMIPGSITVNGAAVFSNGLQATSISSIGDMLALMSDTVFFGRPYLNSDSAGFVLMVSGTQFADVAFEREYLDQPVVNATISLDATSTTSTVLAAVGLTPEEAIFASDIRYLITKKSVKGFTILLNKLAPTDIMFNWLAFAVKNPKIVTSTTSTLPIDTTLPPPTDTTTSPVTTTTISSPPSTDTAMATSTTVVPPPPTDTTTVPPPPADTTTTPPLTTDTTSPPIDVTTTTSTTTTP